MIIMGRQLTVRTEACLREWIWRHFECWKFRNVVPHWKRAKQNICAQTTSESGQTHNLATKKPSSLLCSHVPLSLGGAMTS